MLLHHGFEQTARRVPEQAALVVDGVRTAYAALDRMADGIAATLVRRGVRPGDRVCLLLENGVELVAAAFGVLKAGAVFIPLSPELKAAKLGFIFRDAEPTALVADATLRRAFGPALAEAPTIHTVIVQGDADGAEVPFTAAASEPGPLPPLPTIDQDLAAIIYTSGSTGEPKGVMLTHLNMITAASSVGGYLGYAADDVIFCAIPLSFDYGLYQVLMGTRVGATVVLEPSFAYPTKALDVIARERCTVLPGVPTMFAMLLGMGSLERWDLSSLRTITNTAAALPVSHIQAIRERFPRARLFSMYGLTECKRVTFLPPDQLDVRPASVGRGMPNEEVFLVDDAGRRLPWGSTGELVVRGSHVMRGYWRRPRETADKLHPGEYPGEVLLHTGDIFRTDDEGWLYFVARKDDVIKCKGEKVSPREVENVICDLPAVQEAAVVGEADPLLGEAVKAFVVLKPGADLTERDVVRHCRARLDSHMVPKHVVFVPLLPRTTTGKVSRTVLKSGGG